ncbi:hypothetical protein FOA52_002775 [Chlamydomonas sp. UWO 241]|nr:hypothetical protein FOA52_002775 [Chlamydomonas sp. UWO 241]
MRVEFVEQEEDVEAMDALLRTMYGVTVATDALMLLRAARLMDRFLVSQAVVQVLSSRLTDVPANTITDDLLALVFDVHWASLANLLSAELMDKCRVYLRTAFRNVPDVVTQPALLERFLALPHAAVVAWAQSDSLQVHSENEVAYLLSAWVKAQETAGLPCSAEQLELLVHSVRLADCGPSCLQMIVPALDWFKSSRTVLGKFVVSRALETAAMKYSKDTAVPAAWLADTPREKLASCEAVVEFQVNAGRLEWLYAAENNRINLDSVCVNGFWMTAFLLSRASDTSPGELTLGCHTKIDIAKTTKAVSRPAHVAVAFSLLMKVGKAARRGPTNFIVDANGRGYGDALSASAASVASLVAPHLEGDQLKGKVSFSNVDLLHIRGRRPLEWLVPGLLERFCALPHAAVVTWAQSNSLQVHSENEVIYILSAWGKAEETAGLPCSDEQLKQLAHSVRLADCGPAYLQMIVPSLGLFESGRKDLGRFAMDQTFTNAGVIPSYGPPEALTATPREKLATCEAVVEFQLNAEQLKVLDAAGKDSIISDSVFANGFWVTAFLKSTESKTVPGELTLGFFAHVGVAEMAKVVAWPEHPAVVFACSLQVGKAAKSRRNYILDAYSGRGSRNILSSSAASVAALVAPHLEGGQLRGRSTFSDVDVLRRRT